MDIPQNLGGSSIDKALACVLTEREYQLGDKRWAHEGVPEQGMELLLIRNYVRKAADALCDQRGNIPALEVIRKLGALAFRYIQQRYHETAAMQFDAAWPKVCGYIKTAIADVPQNRSLSTYLAKIEWSAHKILMAEGTGAPHEGCMTHVFDIAATCIVIMALYGAHPRVIQK